MPRRLSLPPESARRSERRRTTLCRALAIALVVAGAGSLAQADATPEHIPHPGRRHASDLQSVIVTLRSQPPAAAYAGRPRALERTLRRAAGRALPAGLVRSGGPIQRLWLLNAIVLRVRPSEIRRLARDPRVAAVEPDLKLRVLDRQALTDDPPPPAPFARGNWGLAAIFAPTVWREYGIDGTGVRVGSIDSGIDAEHPDLAGKVCAWHDFVNNRPVPYDDNGHGTPHHRHHGW